MTSIEAPITFDTGHGEIEDVPAAFIVNIESGIDEPYSWGGGRGTYTNITSATLESIKLGSYWMPRERLEQWIGEAEIDRIEDHAIDALQAMMPDYLEAAE